MKTLIHIFFLAFFLVMNAGVVFGQGGNTTYNSAGSGDWTNDDNWEGDAPPTDMKNKVDININGEGHEITLDGDLDGNNDITIEIFSDATLIITGNVNVQNRFEVIVHESGTFIIEGDVNIDSGEGGENPGELVIDGTASVSGSIEGNGNVEGSGDLYVEGDINEDGINTDEFEGTIAEDIPDLTISAPLLTNVSKDENYNIIYLDWDFDEDQEVEGYEFLGYRIVRNIGGDNHFEEIIAGWFDEDGVIVNDVKETSYEDHITQQEIDDAIEDGKIEEGEEVSPEYFVRAIFIEEGAKNDGTYKLSPKSETEQTTEPLPIELLDFSAVANGEGVIISWTTASEINNDFFTIERSRDGRHWETAGYVDGAGNSNSKLSYTFEDNDPISGISYYRLKQTDYDGSFEYFEPVVVEFSAENKSKLEIMNVNPAGGQLNISLSNSDSSAELIVADIQGRIIHRTGVRASDFPQQITVPADSRLNNEIILIRLFTNEASEQVKIRVF